MYLFDSQGRRLYLTPAEREQFREATHHVSRDKRLFALMLYHTGCRISEALMLKARSIDFTSAAVTVESLKKRQKHADGSRKPVFRQVPLSDGYLSALDNAYDLRQKQRKSNRRDEYLWGWSRQYGYQVIREIMQHAGLEGAFAMPKGLRHAYAIACLDKKIPLNMIGKWMGHASLEVTAIYANALGQEERAIASRLWQ